VPQSIEADISRLAINDSLHVSDLRIPEHLSVLIPLEETIVSVVPPPVLEIPEEEVPEEELPEGEVPEGEVPEGEAPPEGEAAESERAPDSQSPGDDEG
jgi:large subunit ribosomal protein L25